MIVSVFKKDYFLQFVFLLIVPLLLWIPAFLNPPVAIDKGPLDMPLYDFFRLVLPSQSLLTTIVALVLIGLQGLLVNYICTFYKLGQKTSFLPAFVYVLMLSADYRSMTISSIVFANTFIILALFTFLKCYNKKEGLDEIFLSASLISVATLFYAPSVLLLLWIWVGLFNFKIYKLHSFLVSIFGFITPFIVLGVYYYLSDDIATIENFAIDHFVQIPNLYFLNQPVQIVYMAYLFLLSIPAFFVTLAYRNDQKISIRKRVSSIVLLFVFSLLPFVYDLSSHTMSLILAPALSYIISTFLLSIRSNRYSDLYLIVFIILTVVKITLNYQAL